MSLHDESFMQWLVVVVVLPDLFREMGRGGTPRRPNGCWIRKYLKNNFGGFKMK